MESISELSKDLHMSKKRNKSIPIFKFGILCEILPFYGVMHEWNTLCSNLSTQSLKVWEDYQQEFMVLGRNLMIGDGELIAPNLNRLKKFLWDSSINYTKYKYPLFTKPKALELLLKAYQAVGTMKNELLIWTDDLSPNYTLYIRKRRYLQYHLTVKSNKGINQEIEEDYSCMSNITLINNYIQNRKEDKCVCVRQQHNTNQNKSKLSSNKFEFFTISTPALYLLCDKTHKQEDDKSVFSAKCSSKVVKQSKTLSVCDNRIKIYDELLRRQIEKLDVKLQTIKIYNHGYLNISDLWNLIETNEKAEFEIINSKSEYSNEWKHELKNKKPFYTWKAIDLDVILFTKSMIYPSAIKWKYIHLHGE